MPPRAARAVDQKRGLDRPALMEARAALCHPWLGEPRPGLCSAQSPLLFASMSLSVLGGLLERQSAKDPPHVYYGMLPPGSRAPPREFPSAGDGAAFCLCLGTCSQCKVSQAFSAKKRPPGSPFQPNPTSPVVCRHCPKHPAPRAVSEPNWLEGVPPGTMPERRTFKRPRAGCQDAL